MSAPKRKVLTLKEKIEIVRTHEEERCSARDLAKRFNISKTQAAEIVKKKHELSEKWQSGVNSNQKRNSLKGEGLLVDTLCYEWFVDRRNKALPVSGTQVKSKALEIAEKIGYQNFNASDGWLQRFRGRHNISFKCTTNVNSDENLIINKFTTEETGALPNKTETCSGGEKSLLIKGKSKKPRAFKTAKSLPTNWKSNKKTWLETERLLQIEREIDNADMELIKEEIGRVQLHLLEEMDTSINSFDEALSTISKVKSFAMRNGDFTAFEMIENIEDHFRAKAVSQKLKSVKKRDFKTIL